MIYLSRKITFSSAYRYFQEKFSENKNKEIFGSFYSDHGLGHNFALEITISGKVSPETGMVINLVEIDKVLKEVTEPLDHHHLNMDVPFFKEKVPTPENIALYCYEEIKSRLPKKVDLIKVRLYEGENLWADYYG